MPDSDAVFEASERVLFEFWVLAHYGHGTLLWQGDPVFVPAVADADCIDVGCEWEAWQGRASIARQEDLRRG